MMKGRSDLIDALLRSSEPSIRYKVLRNVLQEPMDSRKMVALQQEVKSSSRVRALVAHQDAQGRILPTDNPYRKWQGAHWVLATLADIGYPKGDDELKPSVDMVLRCWLHPTYLSDRIITKTGECYRKHGVPFLDDRARRCASQQGNALYSVVQLGHFEPRCDDLARLLLHWQWPDGGWNCDKKPEAAKSSFYETITPLRGLIAYADETRNEEAKQAAQKASGVFLTRRLYKKLSDGTRMKSEFTSLHYPNYWHYDVLHGLKVMAEGGFIRDERCNDALDLLESMELESGGWPATAKHYTSVDAEKHGSDLVNWGGIRKTVMNEWITSDVLSVLAASGRLSP